MKKILLSMIVCLLTLGIQAQNTNAPALSDNQFLCGYYLTDDLAQYGSGLGSYTSGVCKAATLFDNAITQNYDGFKVVGIRVGLCAAVSDFGIYVGKITNSSIQDFRNKSVGTGNKGWNTVMFDEKEQFNLSTAEELLVGFTYNQKKGQTDAAYPISYYEESDKKGTFFFYGNIPSSAGGSGEGWYTLGDDGALSVQLIVEGNLADQKVIVESVTIDPFVKKNSEGKVSVKVTNMGKNPITSIGFNYYIDGEKAGNLSATASVPSAQTNDVVLTIPAITAKEVGEHTLKIECVSVNGETATTGSFSATTSYAVYADMVARQKHLIEHITSWTCTYCHLGYKLLRLIEKNHDDIAWVALHGNQSSQKDPYYFDEVQQIMNYLGANSFPSASFNRTYIPSFGEKGQIVMGLGYYEQYIPQIATELYESLDNGSPSFVTLSVESAFDTNSRQAQVTIKGKGVEGTATLLAGQKLYIYLTEAGLTGRQYSDGKWETNFSHDNTLRAVLTNVKGDDINWDGDGFTYTTTYTVPTDYAADMLSITAFVAPAPGSDLMAMSVNNCERAPLNLNSGIGGVKILQNQKTEFYDLEGRQTSSPRRGLNIVRMSDGTTRKVFIK